jgi:hypothetical protein
VRVVIAVGCLVLSATTACSSSSPAKTAGTPAASTVQQKPILGIGATRAAWDASHTPNPASDNGSSYGDDPSLPSYLSPNGAIYTSVSDNGTGRIQYYDVNMHTVDQDDILRRIQRELPYDATGAWELTLDQCYRVAFNSAALEAAGHYMPVVQLAYVQEDGTLATSHDRFNFASFLLAEAGTPPNPNEGCT